MSGEQQPFMNDPTQMRVNFQAAIQRVVGSPPPCSSDTAAPGNTAFHTHAGGQAASYLRVLADAESTRNNQNVPATPTGPPPIQYQNLQTPYQSAPPHLAQRQHGTTPAPRGFWPSAHGGPQPPVADLLQMNAAALPPGLQPPLAGPQSSSAYEQGTSGLSLDIEIALDQVADLLSQSYEKGVYDTEAAQALATALLQHYVPAEVANTLLGLSHEQIEQVRDGLLTGAVAIQRGQQLNPFVCTGPAPAGVAQPHVRSGTPPYRTMTGTSIHYEPAPFGMGGTMGESLAAQRAAMDGLDTSGRVPVTAHPMQSLATPQSIQPPARFGLAIPWEEHGPRDLQERTRLAMAEANAVHEWNREAAIKLTGLAVTRGEDPLRMSRALHAMPAHMSSRDTAHKAVELVRERGADVAEAWMASCAAQLTQSDPIAVARLAGCSWATAAVPSCASDAAAAAACATLYESRAASEERATARRDQYFGPSPTSVAPTSVVSPSRMRGPDTASRYIPPSGSAMATGMPVAGGILRPMSAVLNDRLTAVGWPLDLAACTLAWWTAAKATDVADAGVYGSMLTYDQVLDEVLSVEEAKQRRAQRDRRDPVTIETLTPLLDGRSGASYGETRGEYRVLLLKGYFYQRAEGVSEDSANNRLLQVLLATCGMPGLPHLNAVAGMHAATRFNREGDHGLCTVNDAIDHELLHHSDDDAQAEYDCIALTVGEKPSATLERLCVTGRRCLQLSDTRMLARFQAIIRMAAASFTTPMPHPGLPSYINELHNSVAMTTQKHSDVSQLKRFLDQHTTFKFPLPQRARRIGGAGLGVGETLVNTADGGGGSETGLEQSMAKLGVGGHEGGLQAEAPPAAKNALPQGPLQVTKILASGEIPQLRGKTANMLWNTERADGKYGLKCFCCPIMEPDSCEECTYDEFVANHGKPSATNEKLKTTILVHFEAHCRSLRRLVAKHVKKNPEAQWMLEPDPNWMAALREAKARARGG